MHDHIFGFQSYQLGVGLAAFAGTVCTVALARERRIPMRRFLMADGVLLLAALIGARSYAAVETGQNLVPEYGGILSSGLRYPGGLLGVVVGLPIVAAMLRHH